MGVYGRSGVWTAALAACAAVLAGIAPATASEPPEIRTHAVNRVPACVTPQRLDAFLRTRNTSLLPKFASIGQWYKTHGEAWRVRWDYAFYQMVLETNYLMFRRGDGSPGDVSARQNNFAGIGATGGGVPGDTFRDVSSGVLGQIQHLVAYSGELVPDPVAPRTREKQEDIVALSRALKRPVTFADLRNRWAADRNYARSIETIAERFREQFCATAAAAGPAPPAAVPQRAVRPTSGLGRTAEVQITVPVPQRVERPVEQSVRRVAIAAPPGALAPAAEAKPAAPVCRVLSASYGGTRTVLIRAEVSGATELTALTVVEGFERSMIDTYVNSRAPGGHSIGTFPTREAAMTRAQEICPAAG
jgi:hypothetical protein